MENSRKQFSWKTFDVEKLLPDNWQEELVRFAFKNAVPRSLIPTSVTSREESIENEIPILTVGGILIEEGLPWLYDLYKGRFKELGQSCVDEPLSIAKDSRYAINLNFQKGIEMRYECHVDSNPLEGLLYVTSHPKGSGGELVVSNRKSSVGIDEILEDCEIIYPKSGELIFFDAREHPHFVKPLTLESDVRVVIAMNYYTPSCPESARPKDLNKHLFGED